MKKIITSITSLVIFSTLCACSTEENLNLNTFDSNTVLTQNVANNLSKKATPINDKKIDDGKEKKVNKLIFSNQVILKNNFTKTETEIQNLIFTTLKNLDHGDYSVIDSRGNSYSFSDFGGENVAGAYKLSYDTLKKISALSAKNLSNKKDWRAELYITTSDATSNYINGLKISIAGLLFVRESKPEKNYTELANQAYSIIWYSNGNEDSYRTGKAILNFVSKNIKSPEILKEVQDVLTKAEAANTWNEGLKIITEYIEQVRKKSYSSEIWK